MKRDVDFMRVQVPESVVPCMVPVAPDSCNDGRQVDHAVAARGHLLLSRQPHKICVLHMFGGRLINEY